MKTTNAKIYAARLALAKLANTDAPMPLISELAPLLDACDPIIEEGRKIEVNDADGKKMEAFGLRPVILPDVSVPMFPGFAVSYLDFRALREIAKIGEV